MVHQKRAQSWWTVKNQHGSNNKYDNEAKKPGMHRTYSEETDLSETGKWSGTSSGDESWSDMSPSSGKTKLSGEAGLFVPQQPVQGSGEQRTKLSSGASVFVPGQMASQMSPNFSPQLPQTSPMFMPQMIPMDQAMPYMAPCYMAPDGCYYMAPEGCIVCPVQAPVAMQPVPSGAAPPLAPFEAPIVQAEEPVEELSKPSTPTSTIKDSKPKGKSWADLTDDDDSEDPWLQ